MKKTLLFVLILSSQRLSSLSTNIIKHYHYVKISKTWAEAQRYCRETYNDLATVGNQDDNNRLLSVLQGGGEYAWIGLSDDLRRWKWALGKSDFNSDKDFSNWAQNQPIAKKDNDTCTRMMRDGFWHSSYCWKKRTSVCYREKGPFRYKLVHTLMTWSQAKTYCRSQYTDLASVRSMPENNRISSLLSSKTWIGLHRENWAKWSDLTPTTFTNWNQDQPNNKWDPVRQCAVVNTTTGTWWNVKCEESHYFICQMDQHKSTFKLKFQSEADLNDPAVQQQILEQLHTKLEKHGLPDYKLRWTETGGQIFHKEHKREEEEGSDG